MLVQSYGYPRADIHVLSDIPTLTDQSLYATYKNIRSRIDEILRDAEPNDSFFFYYGGLDRVPYKLASGNDKLVAKLRSRQGVIFPTDFETENLFTSRKLNKHILRQVPRGARVTIVLDCVRYFNPLGLGFNYGYDGMALMSPLSSIPVDGSKHRGRYEIVTAHGNHHHRGGGGGGGGGGGSGGRENLMDSLVGSMNSLQLVDARPPTEDSDGQGDIIMISLCRVYTGQQQQGQSASDNASMRFKAAPSALLANALLTSHQSRNTTRGNLTPLPELMNDLYQTVGEWDLAPYVSAGRQIDFHNEYLDI
ncbi:Ca(2+)-dependent cysteine protease [Spiromyces aspiralis]|uniref:Ca(2+)-dependent cysteine protease n=1 Tax=Spiromyces aspiralis TaxID=68401 RepID=A0ACC1HKV5_9FUNG|nr:Ca(2+)-dependent cysteine protease [Spiromyces aspiralis]